MNLLRRDKVFQPYEKVSEYKIERKLGEGRFGICYLISQGSQFYILKQLKRGMLKESGAKVVYEEEVLKDLWHGSIPRFISRIDQDNLCGYILEYKEGKTFEDIIYLDKHKFSREEIYGVGRQLVDILNYLHSKGIVHRDIRVPNTLYDGHSVNLVDFGLARWIDNKKYQSDMDFAFLGDFIIHLYYTTFVAKSRKKLPWYKELDLTNEEQLFLKKLMGVEARFGNIAEVEQAFNETYKRF